MSSSAPFDPSPSADDEQALLIAAYEARAAGDDARAVGLLRRAVDLGGADLETGESREGLAALADLLAERGDWAGALPLYRRGWDAAPQDPLWARGLVTALAELDRGEEARTVARAALAARGDDPALHRLAARLALSAGDREAALGHAREANFLAPHDLAVAVAVAPVLVAAGEALAAAEMLAPLLAHAHPADPAAAAGHVALGRAWVALSEPEKAIRCFRDALALDPDDVAGAGTALAAVEAGGAAGDLSNDYVKALFDRYADRFDTDLTQRLRYQAPTLLRTALDDLAVAAPLWRDGGLDILDLGCGTGLAGVALKDRAAHLAGVDLAPRMVERARAKGVYDRVWAGDLLDALAAEPGRWDLLVAADVLVYLGDLAPVLRVAAAALRPGGRFAATVERWTGEGPFHLHEGRRYAHAEAHVRTAAAAAGLTVERLSPVVPRWEKGRPVDGRLMILRL